MEKQRSPQSGFSLVEALVAIAVLLITLVGPMTIAAQGIKSSQFALEQNTSFFLAQEGIEAIFSIRNDYALTDVNDGLNPADDDSSWWWINEKITVPAGPCSNNLASSDGASCEFGIDFSDDTVADNLSPLECTGSNLDECKLYKQSGSDAPRMYTHNSSGTESPFTRVVTLTRESAGSIKVESTVTWESHAFGGDERTVTLTTYLFDIPYEF